jgi:hypothetical protein
VADDVVVKVNHELADLPRDVREFSHDRLQITFAKTITLREIQRFVIKLRLIPKQILIPPNDGLVF